MDRLTEAQLRQLALDTANNPGVVGAVDVFDGAVDLSTVTELIMARLAYVPRYRQRVQPVPGRLGTPVWVDDEHFAPERQIQARTLPGTGSVAELQDLASEVFSTRLPRDRPLWQVIVVDGYGGGGTLIWKVHPALICGPDAIDLAQELYESAPVEVFAEDWPDDTGAFPGLGDFENLGDFGGRWTPERSPSRAELLLGVVTELATESSDLRPRLRRAAAEGLGSVLSLARFAGPTADAAGDVLSSFVSGPPPAGSPLAGATSDERQVVGLQLSLDGLRRLRDRHRERGLQVSVNDVLLAVLAAGLSRWLLASGPQTLSALTPVAVRDQPGESSPVGLSVRPVIRSLPVGAATWVEGLTALVDDARGAGDSQSASSPSVPVSGTELSEIPGFAAATLRGLAASAASDPPPRTHDVLIINVPGPAQPVHLGRRMLVQSWPVAPVSAGHLMAIAATSCGDQLYLTVNADRAAGLDPSALITAVDSAMMSAMNDLEAQ